MCLEKLKFPNLGMDDLILLYPQWSCRWSNNRKRRLYLMSPGHEVQRRGGARKIISGIFILETLIRAVFFSKGG